MPKGPGKLVGCSRTPAARYESGNPAPATARLLLMNPQTWRPKRLWGRRERADDCPPSQLKGALPGGQVLKQRVFLLPPEVRFPRRYLWLATGGRYWSWVRRCDVERHSI